MPGEHQEIRRLRRLLGANPRAAMPRGPDALKAEVSRLRELLTKRSAPRARMRDRAIGRLDSP